MVRLKTRYLVVEVAAARPKLSAAREDLQGVIRESIARSHGDYGVGRLQHAFQGESAQVSRHGGGWQD
jgi:RNase P/RNase MRP subunit POP5